MRTTVSLDEKVLSEAKSLLGFSTKKQVIEYALKEVIRRKKREKAVERCGTIELELSQAELRNQRAGI